MLSVILSNEIIDIKAIKVKLLQHTRSLINRPYFRVIYFKIF